MALVRQPPGAPSEFTIFRIFIVEGLVTVVVAVIAKWLIVDWPETANFLNEEERLLLRQRLAADTGDASMFRLDKAAIRRIFLDWKLYIGYGTMQMNTRIDRTPPGERADYMTAC